MRDEFGVILLDQAGGYWREGYLVLVGLEMKLCLLLHFVCRLVGIGKSATERMLLSCCGK
jgi:hypothetical protein